MKRAMIGLVAVISGLMLGVACEQRPGSAERGGTTSSPTGRGPGAPASPSGSAASERPGGTASGSATSSTSGTGGAGDQTGTGGAGDAGGGRDGGMR